MNYLTAIIATPLFLAIWLFEVRLFWTSAPRILTQGKEIVALAYASSTLQMISCWFWLFGFALGITKNVLSEAVDEGEEANCVGLVGAEVLLSIFQFLTSLYTLLQLFVVRFVYTSSTKWKINHKMTRSKAENAVLVAFCVLGIAYLPIAWITAWNRRCPQGKPFFTAIQHFFYPTFLIVDGFTSSASFYYANDVLRRVRAQMEKNKSELPTTAPKTPDQQPLTSAVDGNTKPSAQGPTRSKTTDMVAELANFYRFQCKVTLASVMLSVVFFILQFGIRIKFLSLVACVFCTLMYSTYALRRVPMLMKYLRSDHQWLPSSWSQLWDTRRLGRMAQYQASTGTRVSSTQARQEGGSMYDAGNRSSAAVSPEV